MRSFQTFQLTDPEEWWPGLTVQKISFRTVDRVGDPDRPEARTAFGRAVIADPGKLDLVIVPFWDNVGASFPQPPEINLGTTVRDFVEGTGCGAEAPIPPGVRPRIVFACNTIHTCFVRSNGFVFVAGELVVKPRGVQGLDEEQWQALEGDYTALTIDRDGARVVSLPFANHHYCGESGPLWAISGPRILEGSVYVRPPWRPRPGTPLGLAAFPPGPTRKNELNYDPELTRTSFTAFGGGREGRLVAVSMFEKPWGNRLLLPLGMNVADMAALLRELGVTDGIIGGGAADTQQFLRGDQPEFLEAPPRARRSEEGTRPEVSGPRGLGAILALLIR